MKSKKKILVYELDLGREVTDQDIEEKLGKEAFIRLLQTHNWVDQTYDGNVKVNFDYSRSAHGNKIIWKAWRR